MASNVFGKPVRGGTRLDRALKAKSYPNADGKRDKALAYVKKQKQNFRNGVSTLGIFYNATGETLFYVEDHSAYGKIYDSYPDRVQNGQWGAFLHIKKPVVASRSEAFVVYRGKYNDTDFCKQLIAWDVPWDLMRSDNHAYCEIYDNNSDINKDKVYKNMEAGGRQHTTMKKGMSIISSVDEGTSPLYEAQFTLEGPGTPLSSDHRRYLSTTYERVDLLPTYERADQYNLSWIQAWPLPTSSEDEEEVICRRHVPLRVRNVGVDPPLGIKGFTPYYQFTPKDAASPLLHGWAPITTRKSLITDGFSTARNSVPNFPAYRQIADEHIIKSF